ncbi:UNVERIFIED_CONTAM: hypothetical protein GTU68_007713 [Idotea baltica]|nr:hypothetical protein [Idotea baltica]
MSRRPRRNRKSASIRKMISETNVTADDLIYPLFLVDGKNIKQEITTLPGNYRWSIDKLLPEIESCMNVGLHAFVLFPGVEEAFKDKTASYGLDEKNFYLKAASQIKTRFPELTLISDVALDPYSSDGHDGLVKDGKILNDETVELLGQMAVLQAQAGFDIIGPSDMMDGRIAYIREDLDDAGFSDTSIMSYTAKYASQFYGPFRDALESQPKSGDKKTYQMDPANRQEAILEAELDEEEGADFLMVKPAVHYLDVIQSLKQNFDLPIAAYHVSGECAMLEYAIQKGWMDRKKGIHETLTSIKRAGADVMLTYYAKQFCTLQI